MATKTIISEVTSINNNGTCYMRLGLNGVETIEDNSIDYDTHLHIQFDGYDKSGNLVKTFINGNFAIDYKQVEVDPQDDVVITEVEFEDCEERLITWVG